MNENSQSYFSTGEFAQLCGVKKQTLFHYDDIGIFSPDIVKDNGYRYYSVNQLEVFSIISMLKDLQMPLKDIKKYIDTRSPQQLLDLLEKEDDVIDKKIKWLSFVKEMIKEKRLDVQMGLSANHNEITIKDCDEEYLIVTKGTSWSDEKKMAQVISEHINFCEEHEIYTPYSVGSMLSFENVKDKKYFDYNYFYTKCGNMLKFDNLQVKPKGKYLVAYHKGGYATTSKTYIKILEYISANNLNTQGYFYERAILDDITVSDEKDFLLQIAIRLSY